MQKAKFSLVLALLAGVWGSIANAASALMAEDAWIREAPPGATALAGYLVLHNHGSEDRTLVAANSRAFDSVMLHRTVMEDGVAKMVHQHTITLPAGESLTFKPNDYHLMLMRPKHSLKAGDKVDISLEFKNGETLSVTHEVRGMEGEMGHGAMDHGHMGH